MTKLPLDAPIWTRLYGPYGLRDIPEQIAALNANWDCRAAKQLFWEELHHQDDLYPATFAALPWIWEWRGRDAEVLLFLSHVISCAHLPSGRTKDSYRGLSLDPADHAKPWIDPTHHLGQSDIHVLRNLTLWLATHEDRIARSCLAAITPDDAMGALYLAEASFALRGAFDLWQAAARLIDGQDVMDVTADFPLSPEESALSRELSEACTANATLSHHLTALARATAAG